MEQKKLKIPEKEKARKPKKAYKEKKKKVEETYCSRALPQRDFSSSEFASSDSITGKRMSDAIFDLTLNERMNGLACWMKHIG